MSDLLHREISWNGQPKTVLKIKDQLDAIIASYDLNGKRPAKITLYDKQYRLLAEKLRKQKQDINACTYRGYPLASDGGGV